MQHEPVLLSGKFDWSYFEKEFASLYSQREVPSLYSVRIYDYIGFEIINESLFRHLVVARLAFSLSKLKTIEYLYRYQGVLIDTDKIYRFLDRLSSGLKERVEQIAFSHTKRTLKENINVVFYDMTTPYFEASDEDDLRKTVFSKDGKHSNPQIVIGLLVGLSSYPIGYDIFEGYTLIPFLKKIQHKLKISKSVIIVDLEMLSNDNLKALEEEGYEYIIGTKLKNENEAIQE